MTPETLRPFCSFPLTLAPGKVYSIFSLYEFPYSKYPMQVKSYNICPFVSGLFNLA